MIGRIISQLSPSSVLALCGIIVVAKLLYNKFGTGLNHIPGPFLTGFTDIYRLFVVWGRRPEKWHIALHEQYGDLVRIGPRTVICSSNKAAKKIYALNAGFVKVFLSFQSCHRDHDLPFDGDLVAISGECRNIRLWKTC